MAFEETSFPNKACYYIAETTIDDQTYSVRTRNRASHALARILVDAGITDSPMQIISKDLAGAMDVKSFHWAALYTITEGVTTPPRRVRWTDQSQRYADLKTRVEQSADADIDPDESAQ